MLLQSNHNYQERGMKTRRFTPAIDTRYGQGKIVSRIGISTDAFAFEKDFNFFTCIEDILKKETNLACILIDEAHFLTKEQVQQLGDVVDIFHLPILTYGLRTDFKGEPFEGSKYLLALAEELIEIKTICFCGRKATMNLRIDEKGNPVAEGDQIEIGGNERYIPLCRLHFKKELYPRHQKPQRIFGVV